MNTGTNTSSREDYSERSGQSSQQGLNRDNENYQSQEMNREHSDGMKARENYQQDETQYGRMRENETGLGENKQRTENLQDKMNQGMHHAGSKMDEWSDKAENKMDEWSDNAKDKMNDMKDRAQNKMDDWSGKTDSVENKYGHTERKMDRAEEKIGNAHENLNQNSGSSFSGSNTGNDNAEDYRKQTENKNPFNSENPSHGQNR